MLTVGCIHLPRSLLPAKKRYWRQEYVSPELRLRTDAETPSQSESKAERTHYPNHSSSSIKKARLFSPICQPLRLVTCGQRSLQP